MSRLKIAPIVEGHGETASVPILLRRIWYELLEGESLDVLQPIRRRRQRLSTNKDGELENAVNLAVSKLSNSALPQASEVVLILLDADKDLPCELGPDLLRTVQEIRADKNVSCVVANVEYETWFVAAAESLSQYLDLSTEETLPDNPEANGCGKGWIEKRFKKPKYSETIDQPRLTAKMNLHQARQNSPSFDKLCRELERYSAKS